jgi:hypothetical protein
LSGAVPLATTVNVAVAPGAEVCVVGALVTEGAAGVTVSAAATLVTEPTELVITTS